MDQALTSLAMVGVVVGDEDITSLDMIMATLSIYQVKVHALYVRFTCHIFEQTLMHYGSCMFSFAK